MVGCLWLDVYGWMFFKEINCNESFHVPEDCQHDLLYLPLCSKLFLYKRVSVFPLYGLYFGLRIIVANPR